MDQNVFGDVVLGVVHVEGDFGDVFFGDLNGVIFAVFAVVIVTVENNQIFLTDLGKGLPDFLTVGIEIGGGFQNGVSVFDAIGDVVNNVLPFFCGWGLIAPGCYYLKSMTLTIPLRLYVL